MRIAIFGSTGRTGLHLVEQGLARGHQVVAAARSPQKMTIQADRLKVIACDVLQPSTLGAAVEGTDAVIVTISGEGNTRSQGTRNIIAAMKEAGVDRILIVSTAGAGNSISQLSTAGQTFVKTVIRRAVEEHTRQEEATQNSGLRWTIGRPGGLTNTPRSEDYNADPNGEIRIRQISRADVAHFMLEALEDEQTVHHVYGLSR